MKKLLLSLSAFMLVGSSFAQQRMVLVESFSQASCGPCASQNPALETLLAANTTKAVAIKYQVSWPGFDPMYNQNPTEIDARSDYYNITGVPDRVLDGTNQNATQASINARYAVPSPVNMTISHTMNAGYTAADITVTITAPAMWSPANTVLQLGMIEKTISFATPPGSNGETVFHSVMRKMIPNASGTPVVAANFAGPGGSQTFTFTNVAIPAYIYNIQEVGFVAWVQNNTTQEVFQAGISEPLLLPDFGAVQSVQASNYSCDLIVSNATGVFKNTGSTPITTATINYTFNGGPAQTIPYSGNLAPGATANFNIPTLTATASGAQVLTSFLTNINGSGVTTPYGLPATTTFGVVNAAGSTGAFIQNFTNSQFPYADYFVFSPAGNNWARNAANTGCLKYDNYAFAAGSIGETNLAPINLSTITNKLMKFDVAYAQYTNENDKLEVLVTTDCGATWTNVYTKQGTTLSTVPAQTAGFTPTSAQWRNETVDLTAFGSATKMTVKFKATSAYGNNVYVDNINIGGPLSIAEENLLNVSVYPNPATGILNVSFDATGDYVVSIIDLLGREVSSKSNTASGVQTIDFDVTNLSKGSYVVSILSGGTKTTKNIIVQ